MALILEVQQGLHIYHEQNLQMDELIFRLLIIQIFQLMLIGYVTEMEVLRCFVGQLSCRDHALMLHH